MKLRNYEELTQDYPHDAFISYSHSDLEWVKDFHDNLKSMGFKLCLDAKDFIAGCGIENVLNAIDSSRKVIFIITDNFLKSTWGSYEMEMTRMHAFQKGREDMVIVVVKDNIKVTDMPEVMKNMWFKITCIQWPNDDNLPYNTEGIFYEKMKMSLQRREDTSLLYSRNSAISENNVSLEEDTPERDTEELTDVKSHHRFSVFSVDNTNIIFSYDTSHKGICHETFYLEIQDLENENFKVMRHSFPGFIPVLDLEETLLKVDPRQFLLKLNELLVLHLITRREEAKIVQGKLNVDYSEPVDFIEIKIGNSSDILQLEFQLAYTDLLHTMPTKTRLTVIVNDDSEGHGVKPKEKLVKEWKNNLQTELLTDAVFNIMKDYKNLTSYQFDK
ncbi:Hypothetical predicted protein [Mytilus galloprovincialis]|uniref:TIR domain-containing protein n=1 Tax=Mytilus galloprovincialis TaxID=29158 RepID=A0A8B6CC20_MYTGA|nr:Hypothetical predicted protein [Mytilus galloprovincialis]